MMREGTEFGHKLCPLTGCQHVACVYTHHQGTDEATIAGDSQSLKIIFIVFSSIQATPFLQHLVNASSNNHDINCIFFFFKTNLAGLKPKQIINIILYYEIFQLYSGLSYAQITKRKISYL